MNLKFRTTTFILLLALLLLPTGPVYAQGPGPGDGRVVFGSNVTIESGDPFEGDLVVFGGNVTVEEKCCYEWRSCCDWWPRRK